MNLVILGISGGGKGTQAKLLADKYRLVHISMGKLFRQEIDQKTGVGLEAFGYIKRGVWVPTDLTFKVLGPVLSGLEDSGFILDGFPRLPDQPLVLDNFLSQRGQTIGLVIHILVSPEEVLRRRQRSAEQGKVFYDENRKDESRESVLARFESYRKTIAPILDYYRAKGILAEIDGERSVEEIHQDIVKVIEKRVLANG
ncbi:MAG: nucleoside monophosphate kinase [Patescibacteria group bacterium]